MFIFYSLFPSHLPPLLTAFTEFSDCILGQNVRNMGSLSVKTQFSHKLKHMAVSMTFDGMSRMLMYVHSVSDQGL